MKNPPPHQVKVKELHLMTITYRGTRAVTVPEIKPTLFVHCITLTWILSDLRISAVEWVIPQAVVPTRKGKRV